MSVFNPVEVSHVYNSNGAYNVTVKAKNPTTSNFISSNVLTSLVSGSDCMNPEVTATLTSTSNVFRKSERIEVDSKTIVNCSDVVNTVKKWILFDGINHVEVGNASVLNLAPGELNLMSKLMLQNVLFL